MKVRLGSSGGRITRSLGAEKVTPLDHSAAFHDALRASVADVEAEIARVAEAHAPQDGYGETAYNSDTKTVFWVSADWTSTEEHDAAYAAFSSLDGVDAVEGDAEAALPTGEGWTQVWPEQRPSEAATAAERWDRMLGELDEEPVVAAVVVPEPPSPLEQAFAVMGRLVDAVASQPAPAAPVVHVHNNDPEQAYSTMRQMVEAFAARPEASPTTVTVQPAAAPDVHVHPAEVNVSVPEQQAPVVNVAAAEAPRIEVNVPEIRSPDVHVQVAAPDVHVAAPNYTPPDVHVTVEQARPGPVRMEIDEDGTRRFIPEEEGSQE